MISGDVSVARLLEEHPELGDVLAAYHPHFKQLRNRLLRRVMAPRVTVAQAAGMAGVPTEELLAVLRGAVGDVPPPEASHLETLRSEGPDESDRPRALADVPADRQVHVDVREDIHRGAEPFARIMAAVKALGGDQVLVLRAPFEPIRLYEVLARRGLAHWTERHATDDWSVSFYHEVAPAADPASIEPTAPGAARRVVLDIRGLEPPQPMVRVLEEVDRLGPGAELEVHHERRPVFLYPQLDDRGLVHETDEPEPGLIRILIRRPTA